MFARSMEVPSQIIKVTYDEMKDLGSSPLAQANENTQWCPLTQRQYIWSLSFLWLHKSRHMNLHPRVDRTNLAPCHCNLSCHLHRNKVLQVDKTSYT